MKGCAPRLALKKSQKRTRNGLLGLVNYKNRLLERGAKIRDLQQINNFESVM